MVALLSTIDPGHIGIDVGSFLIVVITATIAGTIAALAGAHKLLLPSVVLAWLEASASATVPTMPNPRIERTMAPHRFMRCSLPPVGPHRS
jgi:hypothetical protein